VNYRIHLTLCRCCTRRLARAPSALSLVDHQSLSGELALVGGGIVVLNVNASWGGGINFAHSLSSDEFCIPYIHVTLLKTFSSCLV
jgi:hypothetical protein